MVEQCRELDIAIALSPKGVDGVAAMMRQASNSGCENTNRTSSSRPGTPSSSKTGPGMFEWQVNRGILNLLQDLKTPRQSTGASTSTPIDPAMTGVNSVQQVRRVTTDNHKQKQIPPQNQQQEGPSLSPLPSEDKDKICPESDLHARHKLAEAAHGPLPPGWQAKYDNSLQRIFYVDHNTKTTSWERPVASVSHRMHSTNKAIQDMYSFPLRGTADSPTPTLSRASVASDNVRHHRVSSSFDSSTSTSSATVINRPLSASGIRWEPMSPWCMLQAKSGTCTNFSARINQNALTAAAELFLINGDLLALLYTGKLCHCCSP
jgi:hypothetical protein